MAITPDAIWEAADWIDAEGASPALNAVRKVLGAGSFTTIADATTVRRERQRQRSRPAAAPPGTSNRREGDRTQTVVGEPLTAMLGPSHAYHLHARVTRRTPGVASERAAQCLVLGYRQRQPVLGPATTDQFEHRVSAGRPCLAAAPSVSLAPPAANGVAGRCAAAPSRST